MVRSTEEMSATIIGALTLKPRKSGPAIRRSVAGIPTARHDCSTKIKRMRAQDS
jgi:hypothetical protein